MADIYVQPEKPALYGVDDDKYHGAVVVCESGSDIALFQREEWNVSVVPMHVSMNGETFDDGSFPVERIYENYEKTHQIPKTAASAPGEYEQTFKKLRQQYPDRYILHLCYSAVTTATWANSLLGSEGMEGLIHIDTRQVSGGQTAIILAASKWIQEHPDCKSAELISACEDIISRAQFAFVPDDLGYLKAGGRLSNAAYFGATIFGIKPQIELVNGKLVGARTIRARMKTACRKMMDDMIDKNHFDPETTFLLYTPGLKEEIRVELEEHLKERGLKCNYWLITGGVISTHGGPGAFGFGGLNLSK